MKKLRFKFLNYEIVLFDYAPEFYFLFEFNLNFDKEWGSISNKELRKTIFHLVIFRTRFSLQKVKILKIVSAKSEETELIKSDNNPKNIEINWGAF